MKRVLVATGLCVSLAALASDAALAQQVVSDTFEVRITIEAACVVTAGAASDIDLGTVPATATDVTGTSDILVNCSNTTPYFIGLAPSNGDANGAGEMLGASDSVPYQLSSTPGPSGTIWGNTATSTAVGNGVAGTGTGADQPIPVYVTVPSANFIPGDYVDTVTVNVNF